MPTPTFHLRKFVRSSSEDFRHSILVFIVRCQCNVRVATLGATGVTLSRSRSDVFKASLRLDAQDEYY